MDKHVLKIVRGLYFKRFSFDQISQSTGLDESKIRYIVRSQKFNSKRERYYRFLVNYAYSHGMQVSEVAEKTGVSELSLKRVKRKYKIETKRFNVHNRRITENIKQDMIEMYNSGMSADKIALHFNFKTSKTVLDVLKTHKISRRKPTRTEYTDYNTSCFKKINSHDSAYILGLLYTDGYVLRDYQGVGIQLTISDKYLLERVAKHFGKSATVKNINCDRKRKAMPNVKDMARLTVYSAEISNDLKKLGVVRNKTYILEMASIPKKYLYSFARGVIDGDGTIGVYKNNIQCKFSTKSKMFAEGFQQAFPEAISVHEQKNGMYYVNILGGSAGVTAFLKKMYKNKGDLYLERKYVKVEGKIS